MREFGRGIRDVREPCSTDITQAQIEWLPEAHYPLKVMNESSSPPSVLLLLLLYPLQA